MVVVAVVVVESPCRASSITCESKGCVDCVGDVSCVVGVSE